jgi:hypothetical protein
MSFEESLNDVAIRERQLAAHILRSSEYLKRADQELKRQVSMLYLAIALLLLFQGIFTFRLDWGRFDNIVLTGIVSVLAILNCFLLIQTKRWLRQINESWLNPQERVALDTLKYQRIEIITRGTRAGDGTSHADLN